MLKRLLEKISDLLGQAKPPPPRKPPAAARPVKRQPVRQVYAGKTREVPGFAQGVDASSLIQACTKNVQCEYTPHIEQERIYSLSGRRDMDGNLPIEYEGIAANCGAVKNFGLQVARDDGQVQAYRYVDLNHIFACCCGQAEDCPFYAKAVEERDAHAKQLRKLPDDEKTGK